MYSSRINPQPNYKKIFKDISSINRHIDAESYKDIVLRIVDENVFIQLLDITVTSESDISGMSQEDLLDSFSIR